MSNTDCLTSNTGHGTDAYTQTHEQDLQLPPAFALPSAEKLGRAIELAYDRDFTHIP